MFTAGAQSERRQRITELVTHPHIHHLGQIPLEHTQGHLQIGQPLGLLPGDVIGIQHGPQSLVGHHAHDREHGHGNQHLQQGEPALPLPLGSDHGSRNPDTLARCACSPSSASHRRMSTRLTAGRGKGVVAV